MIHALALLPLLVSPQEPVFEPVVLPALEGGKEDEAKPGVERPVVNVRPDGTIVMGGKAIYDPKAEGADETLHEHLVRIARPMGKRKLTTMTVASGRILIRADVNAPWTSTQKLLEACTREDVRIVGFDFAVRDPELGLRLDDTSLPIPDTGLAQVFPYDLPTDVGLIGEPVEKLEVLLRVRKEGTRIGANEKPWTGTGRYTLVGRELEWRAGPRRTIRFEDIDEYLRSMRERKGPNELVIDARRHTRSGEALAIFSAARRHGYAPISFVGAYE